MLTRLKVKGFKNLVDVELRFGPLTCIAGPNGVGKSNVFDAIKFVGLLADKPFVEAAAAIRGGADLRQLFTVGGDGLMQLECDVLIVPEGRDDFGQPAEASTTFLTYSLDLRLDAANGAPRIEVVREELGYVRKGDARAKLGFPHDAQWRHSVVQGVRTAKYISTVDDRVVLHADRMQKEGSQQRGGGKSQPFAARSLPRTVLSSAQTADETRTAVLLRQEMRRWIQLQLEPSALRRPDEFHAPPQIAADGAHIAATLHRLSTQELDAGTTNAMIANRLAELVDGVATVRVDRDEGRRLLKFMMTDRRGVELSAASLSDGTLRFIALAILEADTTATGVVCLEEPENGIHPLRIAAMLRLLADMAVDVGVPVDSSNPLRQVIVSTHSPLVVASSRNEDVVFASARTHALERPVDGLEFRGTAGSWRHRASNAWISPDEIGRYLGATVGAAATSVGGDETVARALQLSFPVPGLGYAHDSE